MANKNPHMRGSASSWPMPELASRSVRCKESHGYPLRNPGGAWPHLMHQVHLAFLLLLVRTSWPYLRPQCTAAARGPAWASLAGQLYRRSHKELGELTPFGKSWLPWLPALPTGGMGSTAGPRQNRLLTGTCPQHLLQGLFEKLSQLRASRLHNTAHRHQCHTWLPPPQTPPALG